ncbi:PREDICTED: uncharacterized protein LOC104817997 [Tarenaya hassleriana]|uniref:uncharacterized protein LOC104817997 n=1 Tax=Tarenaya hassleriana TaxID=28532 RepID=UPI00053C106C|nr:PREDICTED: uncharacterized protein LOC104817997 [Tarenaya hassleriana]
MSGKDSEPDPPAPTPEYQRLPSLDENDDVPSYLEASSKRRRIIITVFLLSLASAVVYIFWPSDPRIHIERLRISHVRIRRRPVLSVDMSLLVTLKVTNADVYSFGFTTLHVAVSYRGKTLGHVRSDGGQVTAMGSTYVEAETELNGVAVFPDVIHLIRDLAKGSIEFDTVTETSGKLGIMFLRFPLKAKVECGILVNTVNQTISRQSCKPV